MNQDMMKPTVEWMARNYDRLNSELFGGELGKCDFEVFTTGSGANGRVLGWFAMNAKGLKANRYTGQLFIQSWHDKIYIDHSNFVSLCKPIIKLNGNYSGTEHAMLATLVHEMCHYYTYMNGICPKRCHGPEFKRIGEIVSSRSNGEFTIQRLASAEEMSERNLDAHVVAKNKAREDKKKSRVTAVFVVLPDNSAELTIASNPRLVNHVSQMNGNKKRAKEIIVSNDASVIDWLFNDGYKREFRTYRYWTLPSEKMNAIKALNANIWNVVYSNPKYGGDIEKPQSKPEKKRIFTINTSNGRFETIDDGRESLFKKLKERFPTFQDNVITKLMDNQSNYRTESKKTIKQIVEATIKEYLIKEAGIPDNDKAIDIPIGENLGILSPFEEEF